MDRLSLGLAGGLPWKTRELRSYLAAHPEFANPRSLDDVDAEAFDIVLYPGGHGPMQDLAVDPVSGALLTKRLTSGKPLGLLCHGPAAALAAENPDGSWPFAGYRMTALSNREERLNWFARKAKWLLQDRLVAKGARYTAGLPLRPYVVVDRNLYTGQNPASSAKLAHTLVAAVHRPALRVSVSRTIQASADAVYSRISDITTMGEHSPETRRAKWLKQGAKFKGYNQIGPFYRWSTVATITENIPGQGSRSAPPGHRRRHGDTTSPRSTAQRG